MIADQKQVDSTLSLSSITTVPALLAMVGEATCNRWVAIGQTDSKVHWQYGKEAEALISEGARVGVVCKAIAVKAGRSSETVRKAYYTYTSFTEAERKQYDLCPYSIFQHARTQEKPLEVLQYYIDNQASVDEVETVYPPIGDDKEFDTYFNATKYPRYFYGICRELYGIDPIWKQEADEHLKALNEIIKQVNK
jgi:hypothetical protein